MRTMMSLVALAGTILAGVGGASAATVLSMDDVQTISKDAIETVRANYVIEERAHEIADEMTQRLEQGQFDHTDPVAFAEAFNLALAEVSQDLHMSFAYDPNRYEVFSAPREEAEGPSEEEIRYFMRRAENANFGFEKVRMLPGRIGYVNITGFHGGPNVEAAMNKTRAAMDLVHGANAVIIDVRSNGGGSAEAVRMLQSWFFKERTHVLTFHNRSEGIVEDSYTLEPPSENHLGDTSLYVLTSGFTGSAAEDFAYIMKAHEKATLVGERTAGAGHTVGGFAVAPAFILRVSVGRPVSPVTNDGWEGVGVVPHIQTGADEALGAAQVAILTGLLDEEKDPMVRAELEWALVPLQAADNPPSFTSKELKAMAGTYGVRTISVKDGGLLYTREGRPPAKLIPLTKDTFQHEEFENFRIKFVWEGGKVIAIEAQQGPGRSQRNPRDR